MKNRPRIAYVIFSSATKNQSNMFLRYCSDTANSSSAWDLGEIGFAPMSMLDALRWRISDTGDDPIENSKHSRALHAVTYLANLLVLGHNLIAQHPILRSKADSHNHVPKDYSNSGVSSMWHGALSEHELKTWKSPTTLTLFLSFFGMPITGKPHSNSSASSGSSSLITPSLSFLPSSFLSWSICRSGTEHGLARHSVASGFSRDVASFPYHNSLLPLSRCLRFSNSPVTCPFYSSNR